MIEKKIAEFEDVLETLSKSTDLLPKDKKIVSVISAAIVVHLGPILVEIRDELRSTKTNSKP